MTDLHRTLVVATSSKPSEFSFELSLTAGEVYELDSEPMSDSLKVAAMQNGSLPTEWLVCVTAAGKRRLIKKGLVERVEETQARMIQLKKASEVLVDAVRGRGVEKTECFSCSTNIIRQRLQHRYMY